MVNVVAALPPANRKTAAEVGDKDANQCVFDKAVGYSSVSGIMGSEHYLMLGKELAQGVQV